MEANTWPGSSGSPATEAGFSRKELISAAAHQAAMTPNWLGLVHGDPDTRHGHARSGRKMLLEHLTRVHPVDVIGAEDAE